MLILRRSATLFLAAVYFDPDIRMCKTPDQYPLVLQALEVVFGKIIEDIRSKHIAVAGKIFLCKVPLVAVEQQLFARTEVRKG